jgi:hypothetical protein
MDGSAWRIRLFHMPHRRQPQGPATFLSLTFQKRDAPYFFRLSADFALSTAAQTGTLAPSA